MRAISSGIAFIFFVYDVVKEEKRILMIYPLFNVFVTSLLLVKKILVDFKR